MSKTLVEDPEDPEDQTQTPFLRGILIRSLQDAGIDFEEASDLASDIRSQLSDTEVISTEKLGLIVLERLESLGKENISRRYQNRNLPLTIQVEHSDGRVSPFSRSEFRQSLETIGLKSRESDAMVQILQEHLSNRNVTSIKSSRLAMLVYRYLRQSNVLGPAVAHRWLVWQDFVNSGRAIIFLLA